MSTPSPACAGSAWPRVIRSAMPSSSRATSSPATRASARRAGGRRAGGDPVGYAFVEPGNVITGNARLGGPTSTHDPPERLPQMPAFHLVQPDSRGITMINIGPGPSNARNITDHVAVLRPHAWLMLGHCAGLRNTQKLGDYVLAHGDGHEAPRV